MQQAHHKPLLIIGIVFYLLVTLFAIHFPFFWDSILTSSISQWFYDNGVQSAIPPLIWDAGHPTIFQIYISTMWKIFGKTLAVSHLSMLPFLCLMVYLFLKIIWSLNISKSAQYIGLSLLLLHPYILTQSTLISYDIVQIPFFLLILLGILKSRNTFILIGFWGLSACSIRGQMIAVTCLALYSILEYRNLKKNIFIIFFAVIPFIAWHLYHLHITGWMISTPSSTWQGQRDIANFSQIIKNTIGILRTYIDYGAIALTLLFLISITYVQKESLSSNQLKILLTVVAIDLVLSSSIILFSNPVGHRYFMIIHVGILLFVISIWDKIQWKKSLYTFTIICFISGHFWLYPYPLSNGWDVSLKYISYEKNRAEFWAYIQEQSISPENIGSGFPLFCSLQQTNLIEGMRLTDMTESKYFNLEYIAYSPVCNDMKNIIVDYADSQQYKMIKSFGKGKTAIILYQKTESDN
ncbi:MAG: hypothetical protein M9958_10150 [Chitinophagales bacterium]|nr:hypothetical protein [Chitinophagales bacterium]